MTAHVTLKISTTAFATFHRRLDLCKPISHTLSGPLDAHVMRVAQKNAYVLLPHFPLHNQITQPILKMIKSLQILNSETMNAILHGECVLHNGMEQAFKDRMLHELGILEAKMMPLGAITAVVISKHQTVSVQKREWVAEVNRMSEELLSKGESCSFVTEKISGISFVRKTVISRFEREYKQKVYVENFYQEGYFFKASLTAPSTGGEGDAQDL